MAKDAKRQIIAGLDIGSTKVSCVIGHQSNQGLEVIGVGVASTTGMRQGSVVNIEVVSESIRKAREEAELMAGVVIEDVWVAVGGQQIQSFDSTGMVAVRNREVQEEDIERVIEAAKAVVIPNDRQVLHVLPQDFKVDGQVGIHDPIGMSGVRLEASVHIVTGSQTAILNSIKCIQRAGLRVAGVVLQQLASARAVLSQDEKNLGVCVADIGGGTCDLITFFQGSVVHTASILVGGQNFTQDVAMGLKTTQQNAEALKKKFGCAIPTLVNEEEVIEVESVGGRKPRTLQRRDLCEILEARSEETFELIQRELESRGWHGKLGSGVVLTGGASHLEGFVEMGDFVLDVPVRLGTPQKVGGLTDVVKSTSFATGVGLLLHGLDHGREQDLVKVEISVADKLTSWARRFFAEL